MNWHIMIFLMSSLLVGSAWAKKPADCHRELKALCKSKMGTKEFFSCMKENVQKLDEECQGIIDKGKKRFKTVASDHPCLVDREKCKDSGGGHVKMMKCLLDKRAELSDSCKHHIEEKVLKVPCFEERLKFCDHIEPGEGRIYGCLKAKEKQLSDVCKSHLAKSQPADLDKED